MSVTKKQESRCRRLQTHVSRAWFVALKRGKKGLKAYRACAVAADAMTKHRKHNARRKAAGK